MQIVQFVLSLYDTLLIYHSNVFFVGLPIFFLLIVYGLYRIARICAQAFTYTIDRTHWKQWIRNYRRIQVYGTRIVRAIRKEVLVDE